ncbi:SEL1-like repeat protein [Imtechella halotolerans]|uniref:Sel1 domain-containing protein repeat-containing protein n=1 Tax=Imtechella halotolerans K1 TaxID=946077 RepID=I0WBY6_9FLAO|nr:SEL1-like repeat protein [Imtechella halotolerans]EID73902.1 Sel1 domain-containing protein repeat-containing protein [Imtechella halotolerans K1]WMQ64111.1 SEL1-like repeat protein [Imtechella halotolerans]
MKKYRYILLTLIVAFNASFLFSQSEFYYKDRVDMTDAQAAKASDYYKKGVELVKSASDGNTKEEARLLFENAAKMKHLKAMVKLAEGYTMGEHWKIDADQAIYWAKQAFDREALQASYYLAYIYFGGLGEAHIDYKKSRNYCMQFIEMEKKDPTFDLGSVAVVNTMYGLALLEGYGGKKNRELGLKHLKIACDHGLKEACQSYNGYSNE